MGIVPSEHTIGRSSTSGIDIFLAVLSLLVTSGAGLQLFILSDDAYLGSQEFQLLYGTCYALVAIRVLQYRRKTMGTLFASPALCLLVVYAALSCLWSDAPEVTLRRSVALAGTVIASLHISTVFTRDQMIRLLAWVFSLIIVASIVTAVYFPDYGLHVDSFGLSWKGIYLHKNGLGQAAAFALLIWTVLASFARGRRAILCVAMLTFSLFALVMSDSASSVVVAICLVLVWPCMRLLRARPIVAASAASLAFPFAIVVVPILVLNAEPILSLLGREITLTGRTGLWPLVWAQFADSLWIGHGYGAFWLGTEGSSRAIWSQLTWTPSHSHNGYLDVGLQLGVVGVAGVVFLLAKGLTSSIWNLRVVGGAGEWFSLGLLMYTMALNSVESTILLQNNIFWLLLCTEIFRLNGSTATREERLRRSRSGAIASILEQPLTQHLSEGQVLYGDK
jgi:exopolysaccharide production protein ExoQ